jgi:hypothetical protein
VILSKRGWLQCPGVVASITGEGGRGVCSGVDERARRGRGEGAPVVLRPFYRRRTCGDGEGKWVGVRVARGATRRREVGEGGLVLTVGRRPDRQRPGRGAMAARTGKHEGPLMRGPQLAVGGRGRGERRGAWVSPWEKEVGRACRNRGIFYLFK